MEGSRALAARELAGKSSIWILGDATGRGCGVDPATQGDQTYNKKKKKKREGRKARTGAWAGWDENSPPSPKQKREPWQPDRVLELTRLQERRRG